MFQDVYNTEKLHRRLISILDKMNRKKTHFLALLMCFFTSIIYSQETDIYSLLTEKYVERPLAMHKGQVQVNTGYEFSIINKSFNVAGDPIDLRTDGSVFAKHLFPIDLRFGILEFIQLNIHTNYGSMAIRSQINWLVSLDTNFLYKELTIYKGLDDLYLGLDLTVPIPSDFHINCVLTGGIHLPVFGHEPDKPSHSIQILEPLLTQTPGTALQYNNKFGSGVPVLSLGSDIKFHLSKFSFIGSFFYQYGLKDGESITWRARYKYGAFEYISVPYEYSIRNEMSYYGEFAWQAINWFAVTAFYSGFKHWGGWSGITGQKVAFYDESLHSVGLGYEIQISPAIRFIQKTVLPVTGKNIMAPWMFHLGISLNFIPSWYH
jgi:hypothetical protein